MQKYIKTTMITFAIILTLATASAISIDNHTTDTTWVDLDDNGFEEPYLIVNATFSNVNMTEDTADIRFFEPTTGNEYIQKDRSIGEWRRFISSPNIDLNNDTTYYVNITAYDASQNDKDTLNFEYTYDVVEDDNKNFNVTLSDENKTLAEKITSPITSAVNALKGLLYSLVTALVNAISVIAGATVNTFKLGVWATNNYVLQAQGNTWDTNETFTYYNYTGEYPVRLNDTDAEALDVFLKRYNINTTYTSFQYLDDVDAGLIDDPDPVYTLGTVNDRTYTINAYGHETEFYPEGIGGFSLTLNRLTAVISIFLYGVINMIPDPFVNIVNLFIEQAKTIGRAIAILGSTLFGAIDFALNEGSLIVLGGIKGYVLLVAMYYGDIIGKLIEGDMNLNTGARMVSKDIQNKFEMFMDMVLWTWQFVESGFNTVINVLRFVYQLIPFI